jgi:hypothetical protein
VCTFTNKLEHLTPQSDEAIQNIASLYNKDKLTIGSLDVTGKANVESVEIGNTKLGNNSINVGGTIIDNTKVAVGNSNITNNNITGRKLILNGGSIITAPGRMHITGEEILYLLNKDGVVISKAWGGTGDLKVTGKLNVKGNTNVSGRIYRKYPDTRAIDGWDIWTGKSDGFQDCIGKCRKFRNATTSLHRKSDNQCWCKSSPALHQTNNMNEHNKWNTALFI